MEKSVALVVKGFLALGISEREEFIKEINKYLTGSISESILDGYVQESFINNTTVNFGPAPGGCPYCGK